MIKCAILYFHHYQERWEFLEAGSENWLAITHPTTDPPSGGHGVTTSSDTRSEVIGQVLFGKMNPQEAFSHYRQFFFKLPHNLKLKTHGIISEDSAKPLMNQVSSMIRVYNQNHHGAMYEPPIDELCIILPRDTPSFLLFLNPEDVSPSHILAH